MREHFNISDPNNFLDPLFLSMKKVKVDIIALNVLMDDEYKGSLSDEIQRKYGTEALTFIKKFI